MPHNKNTDKVVKRLLPWIIILGFFGLVIYIFMPSLTAPPDNYSNASQQDLDTYLSPPTVTLENDLFIEQIQSLKEDLYHDIPLTETSEQATQQEQTPNTDKPLILAPDVGVEQAFHEDKVEDKAENKAKNQPSNEEDQTNSAQTDLTSQDSTSQQVLSDTTKPSNDQQSQVNIDDSPSSIDNQTTEMAQVGEDKSDNTQDTQDTQLSQQSTSSEQSLQSSGGFVKHLAVYEQQNNYWHYIKHNQENKTLVEQLQPLHKLLSRSNLIKVEILYTDYVKNSKSNPENSKIIAVRGTTNNKTWIYFAHFEKDDIYYYDYDGNTPEPSMDRVPLNYTRITSPFNPNRRHPISGRIRPHDGVDLKAPYGAPVHSTGDGIVSFAGWQHGYGRLVSVKHPNGYETRYAHMSAINVAVGDVIKRGTVVGKVGNSGISTGHHLHYEVRVDGIAKDPMTIPLPSFKPISRDYLDIWHFRAEQYQVAMKELTKSGYTVN